MKYLPSDKVVAGHVGYQQQVKETNIKRIFDLVRSGKCKSRAEIVRYMNLSATSVSVLVEELAERGLIDETGPAQTTQPGRRPISLRLNGNAHQLAVFSVLPSGIRYTLFNLDCRVIETLFFTLDSASLTVETAGEAYIKLFEETLSERSRKFSPRRALMVGISFPGIYIERDQLLLTAPALGYSLTEADIRRFKERIGLPVYLLNSTRSRAYAEKKHLDAANAAAPEIEDMLFVQVQEDIRCGIIAGGNLYTGPFNVSGEIGHISIDHEGRPCPCGNAGCLERYVSLSAILSDARQAAEAAGIEAPETLEALAARYPQEPALRDSVRRSAELLACGLYSVLCTSGMRRIVLGGGIEALGEDFLAQIYRALCRRTLLIRSLDLSYAQAGPDAESVGVAQHYLDKVYTVTM